MFHPNTERLIADWRMRRGPNRAPARADLSPADLRTLLPQVFMLGIEGGSAVVRLAGALVADLHARPLKGEGFLPLWAASDQARVEDALEAVLRRSTPAVLGAAGTAADGAAVGLQVVLAPLYGPSGALDRLIGLYQPTTRLHRLMGQPVQALSLQAVEFAVEPQHRSSLKLVVLDGQRVA